MCACVCVCFFKKCFVYLFFAWFLTLLFVFSLVFALLSPVCLFVLSFKKAALLHLIFKFAHELI